MNINIIFPKNYTVKEQEEVKNFGPFKRWVKNNRKNIDIDKIEIYHRVLFTEKAGFVYARMYDKENKLPGITLLRGDSVAMLIVLNVDNEQYAILTEQYRVPVGEIQVGLAAGMVDGPVLKTVIKEMKEEVDNQFEISEKDLILLSTSKTSSGVLDENIHTYFVEKNINKEELESYIGKKTGSIEENEDITLRVIKLDELKNMGSRSRLAYYDYKEYKNGIN